MSHRMPCRTALFVLVMSWGAATAPAEAPPASEPNSEIHNALRGLRDRLVVAINAGNIDGIVAELHPNVIVTWENAEVSRGHQGVRSYLERMTKGPQAIVRSHHAAITVDEVSSLYGDNTGIAYGSSIEEFNLADGQTFTLNARWSATMIREQGRWLLANFHASTNLFDNPLLNAAKKALLFGAPLAGLGGLVVGVLLGRRTARRPS